MVHFNAPPRYIGQSDLNMYLTVKLHFENIYI